ncbi:guanyl-specific ribonuclease C2 [Armillaria novae-zelandiae]|uniref:Guanyl-specific ribonuclease C2 n=1 Tax=Armillaria novae-zelandiae TaxID=153914 RepID=A0AA39UMD7_9AGAR|nr:guanyl-specific ribonuclease C2 [Armillaria novae-zelandiae]
MFHQSLAILVTLLAFALAVPALPVGSVTCGTNSYTPTEVQAAITAGRTTGSQMRNHYPHQYRNFEGLNMQCAGPPYNEYPILPGGLYTSGPPGADRVVFNNAGDYCTVMTHTGAVRNGFRLCIGV